MRRVLVARLVGDEQLDGGPGRGIGEATGRDELLEFVAERGREQVVDDLEDLRARAPVVRERQHLTDLIAALLEHLDVGVQEAVDRLELVADEEELVAGDEVDQLALEPVRVLELVDADLPEAQLLALADRFVIAEQVAGPQLEVVVVERGLAVLRRLVAAVEAQEELLEQLAVTRGDCVERRLLGRLPGLLVLVVALDCVLGEVEQRLRGRVAVEQLDQAGRVLRPARRRRRAQRDQVEPGRVAERELERSPRRPQRLVDAGEHPPQRLRAVDREQPQPLGLVPRAELRQRLVERLDQQHRRLGLVEHAKPRVEPGRERVLAKEPRAEAVNRRDPGAVELARQLRPAELGEPSADSRAQLGGRAVGVGDDEDRADVDAGFDRADEALDEHGRLPRPRPGGDKDEPGRADGGGLLGSGRTLDRRRHYALFTRHIGASWHQDGHVPSRGSWCTSPSRMRPTISRAASWARPTRAQKSSSST